MCHFLKIIRLEGILFRNTFGKQGVVRFFSGYAGWMKGQLRQEIEDNIWLVNNDNKVDLLNMYLRDLWQETLTDLGGKYAIWARYPQFPSMN